MSAFLFNTVSALTIELAAKYDGRRERSKESYGDVIRFVLEQLNRMPWFLAFGVKFLTALFGVSRLIAEGNLFYQRPAERRRIQVEKWVHSKLAVCRALMKFYASLVVLSLYSGSGTDREQVTQ